jgi:hypothetical protein
MISRRHFITAFAATPFFAAPAFACGRRVFTDAGLAIRGIDPVAYFREGGPVAGADAFQLMWHRAVWRFVSLQNMAAFERDPYRFAPQYGGFCAMSLTQGTISRTAPDAWAIHDAKLYLAHAVIARDRWQTAPDANIAKADANWPAALCS